METEHEEGETETGENVSAGVNGEVRSHGARLIPLILPLIGHTHCTPEQPFLSVT